MELDPIDIIKMTNRLVIEDGQDAAEERQAASSVLAQEGYTNITGLFSAAPGIHTYRAVRDGIPYLLKTADPAEDESILRLRSEWNLLEELQLKGLQGILFPSSWEVFRNVPGMAFRGVTSSYRTLAEVYLTRTQAHDIEWLPLLHRMRNLCQTLSQCHALDVRHGNIRPEAIMTDMACPTSTHGNTFLTSWLYGSRLAVESPALSSSVLNVSLQYAAPECTGRTNRAIDFRADLYSLGVTLYQLICLQLPFTGSTKLEIIHKHISETVIPPSSYLAVPEPIELLVLRLLRKTPEDRYQSASGLLHDLDLIICSLNNPSQHPLSAVQIGKNDHASRFIVSPEFIGRDYEISALVQQFKLMQTDSQSRVAIIAGYSGVGKSRLVTEALPRFAKNNVFYAECKFDQYKGFAPFSTMKTVIADLLAQVFIEPPDILQLWRSKIAKALGNEAQSICDLCPDLIALLTPEHLANLPPVVPLQPLAAEERLKRGIKTLIQAFASPRYQLVIFVDDLQWSPLIDLQMLLSIREQTNLFLICAYRDAEVGPDHIVSTLFLSNVAPDLELSLEALPHQYTTQLICATLHRPVPSEAILSPPDRDLQALADFIYLKTQGNCFFITQILTALYRSKLLTFDFGKGYWTWQIEAVLAAELSDDVVTLVVRQVTTLARACQDILKVASCLGNSGFQLDMLELTTSKSRSEIARELFGAMTMGLVVAVSDKYKSALALDESNDWIGLRTKAVSTNDSVPLQDGPYAEHNGRKDFGNDLVVSYRFLHDRVQQAVYALIPPLEKPRLHLGIGMSLLEKYENVAEDAMLFDICNQVNKGQKLVEDAAQGIRLGVLNLKAARAAFRNTANGFALELLQYAERFLPSDLWQFDHEVAETYFGLLEEVCASLARYDEALEAASIVLERSRNPARRIRMYQRQVKTQLSKGTVREALLTGAAGLAETDIDLARFIDNPDESEITKATEKLWQAIPLDLDSISNLEHLPFMVDERQIAATDLLVSILPPIFFHLPSLVPLLVLTGVKTTIDLGVAGYSPYYMAFLGMILCEVDNDRCNFAVGLAYTEVCEKILDALIKQSHHHIQGACSSLTLTGCTYVFTRNARIDAVKSFALSIELALRCFDGEYIAYSVGNKSSNQLFAGEPLESVAAGANKHLSVVTSYNREVGSCYVLPTLQAIHNLIHLKSPQAVMNLSGSILADEANALTIMQQESMLLHQVFYWATKAMLSVLCNDREAGLRAVVEGSKVIGGSTGVPIKVHFETFALLIMTDAIDRGDDLSESLESYRNVVCRHIDIWSSQNDLNFGCWKHIKEIATNKQDKPFPWILERYDLAIAAALNLDNQFLMGLFNERCAKYLVTSGYGRKIALGYARDAMLAYRVWGCDFKVASLADEFDVFLEVPTSRNSGRSENGLAYDLELNSFRAGPSNLSLKRDNSTNSSVEVSQSLELASCDMSSTVQTRGLNRDLVEARLTPNVNDTSRTYSAELDLATVISNFLLISKALHTSDIIEKLLRHLLQVAGAANGALILDIHQDHHFTVAATAHVDKVELHDGLSLDDAGRLVPIELIRLAANSKRYMIDERKYMKSWAGHNTAGKFQRASFMPKSFMALPVLLNDKVIAVAYLSNDQISNLFTEQKVELLTILAAQAAISLEKGRIYSDLKIANEELSNNKRALEHHTERLEAIVSDRTAQLQTQNDTLSEEIKQRTHIEAELVQAKDAAEQATVMKSRFLAMMSHEMRTPFNAVIGFSTLLLDTELTAEQHDMAQSIVDASSDLITIINDILDFSKIENDKMNLDPIWFELRSMVESTVEVVSRDATKKEIKLAFFENHSHCGSWVFADNTRMRQCLLNLLSNAVKFTPPEGQVSLHTNVELTDVMTKNGDQQGLVTFTVKDSGIGISEKDQQKLFQFFSQVDDSITRRYGGTGLGLAISHKICQLFGGDLSVDSEPGKGSTFTATFKATFNKRERPPEQTVSKVLEVKKCLVLEPDVLVSDNLIYHLTAFGMEATVKSKLEDVKAAASQFDLAIIGDSFAQPETIRALRQMNSSIPRLPLVVLMPFGATMPQQPTSKDLDTIDAVVSAPVRRMRLFRSLQSLFPGETGVTRFAKPTKKNSKTVTNPGESFPRTDLNLLLVEDNLINVKVATQILKRSGYVPKVAHDGIEAVAACANEFFDLILMDLSMPRMDGLEATRAIRASEMQHEKPYICAMTANAMSTDRQRCLDAGMNDYITKPVMLPHLAAVLDKVRDRVTGSLENCRQVEAVAHEEQQNLMEFEAESLQRRRSMTARLGSSYGKQEIIPYE